MSEYWKFNTSLLNKKDFKDQLKQKLKQKLTEFIIGNKWGQPYV